jgi:phage shock protein E
LIIDVRTPKERELLGYYPNSIPISLDTINKQVPLDIADKSTSILIYCNAGSRAAKAAEILYRMGYTNVRYITESYLKLMPGSS